MKALKNVQGRLGRRGALSALGAFGGGVLLRSIATGLPAKLLLDPLSASADDMPSGRMLVLSSSRDGDPLNANVPGTYGFSDLYHSADPAMQEPECA